MGVPSYFFRLILSLKRRARVVVMQWGVVGRLLMAKVGSYPPFAAAAGAPTIALLSPILTIF